jgi:DUF917 family protein
VDFFSLDHSDVLALAYGGIILSSGGAGSNIVAFANILADYLKTEKKKVKVIPYHELPNDYSVFSVAMFGSPEIMQDNPPDGSEAVRAIRILENECKIKCDAILSLEGASVNAIYPLMVAARTGLPVVDGDGCGRAFPDLQMSILHIYGHKGTPFVATNLNGEYEIFNDENNFLLALNIQKALMKYGGVGYAAGFVMTGEKTKESIVPGTITFAIEMGEAIQAGSYETAMEELVQTTKNSIYGMAIELFIGTITEIKSIEHLKLRSLVIQGIKGYEANIFDVYLQNENVFAFRNNKIVAMAPDLISFLDYPSGQPLGNLEVSRGMDIAVIAIPSPNVLRTSHALAVIGPSSFGYKMEFEPLEQLHSSYYFGS